MSDDGWAGLRHALVSGYAEILRRLTDRLGSHDLAQDALHDTFLRIERGGEIGDVRKPRAFLIRMALNAASNHRRSTVKLISGAEGRALLDAVDLGPNPEEITAGRRDIDRLHKALAELSDRRRAIFVAAWGEGLSRQEIADRFGIAVRTVKHEITLARQHCATRLGRADGEVLPFSLRHVSHEGSPEGIDAAASERENG